MHKHINTFLEKLYKITETHILKNTHLNLSLHEDFGKLRQMSNYVTLHSLQYILQ